MPPVVHLGATEHEARPLPVLARISLAELTLLTDRLGGVPLPIDLPTDVARDDGTDGTDRLQERLADGAPSTARRAGALLRAAVEAARTEPAPLAVRLHELGLLDAAGTPVGDVVAAFGVLAGPEALIVLDLAVRRDDTGAGEDRLRSWFAVTGTSVVQLATVSGLAYELAWYDVADLPDALARAAMVEDDDEPADLADHLELPFELFTDGTEAVRRGRDDLLAELVRIAPGPVRVDGAEVSPVAAAGVVTALERGSRGRLRVLVTVPRTDPETDAATRRTVGVVSWLRVGPGWRSLTPVRVDGVPTLRVDAVTAADLPRVVAPVLAEVVR